MRYVNNYKHRGVWAYENRREQRLEGNYEERLVEIIAKFSSRCRETGNAVKAGERIVWLPGTGVIYSQASSHWQRFKQRQGSVSQSKKRDDHSTT